MLQLTHPRREGLASAIAILLMRYDSMSDEFSNGMVHKALMPRCLSISVYRLTN